ncbi:MAG: hypothetical protein M3N53_06495 [Actinomycetota bacterium]|nr:hypothetical protein [Actinomycetota bacterium]
MPTLLGAILMYNAARSGFAFAYVFALVMTMVVIHFCSVHMRVGADSIEYGFGMWMSPKRTINYDQINNVEVINVNPLRYGGWGLRGSRHAIARRGPGLLLNLGGSQAVITTDGADEAADLIRQHMTRTAVTPSGNG